MRLRHVRLTVHWLMISVAVIALVLSIEISLWDRAVSMVCEGSDREYLLNEAVEVWLFLNVAMAVPAFALFKLCRQGSRAASASPSLAIGETEATNSLRIESWVEDAALDEQSSAGTV